MIKRYNQFIKESKSTYKFELLTTEILDTLGLDFNENLIDWDSGEIENFDEVTKKLYPGVGRQYLYFKLSKDELITLNNLKSTSNKNLDIIIDDDNEDEIAIYIFQLNSSEKITLEEFLDELNIKYELDEYVEFNSNYYYASEEETFVLLSYEYILENLIGNDYYTNIYNYPTPSEELNIKQMFDNETEKAILSKYDIDDIDDLELDDEIVNELESIAEEKYAENLVKGIESEIDYLLERTGVKFSKFEYQNQTFLKINIDYSDLVRNSGFYLNLKDSISEFIYNVIAFDFRHNKFKPSFDTDIEFDINEKDIQDVINQILNND